MLYPVNSPDRPKSANPPLIWLGILILLSSCSNAEVENQLREDLLVVELERDNAIAQHTRLNQELSSLETAYNTLSGNLDSAMNNGDALQKELDSTKVELDSFRDKLTSTIEERDNLQEVRDQLQNDLDSTNASQEILQSSLDSIYTERDELLTFNEELKGRISGLQDELRKLQSIFSQTQISLSTAENRVQELLLKYDEEIRADLLAEANAEIEQACRKAIEHYNDSIESSTNWNISWSPVITKVELITAVEKCAEPGRSNADDVDTEIERACEAAIEQYDSPVASIVQWKSSWSTVMSQDELIEAVAICAEPQRSRFINLKAEVDLEIEKACGFAIERYSSSVESNIRWNNNWSQIISREDFVNKVAKCAENGRANAVAAWAEIDRACDVAVERYRTPISSLIKWRSSWSSVMSRDELIEAVEDCAEPDRSQAAERAAFLENCERISVDQVLKNPDGLEGECFVLHARIVQFDSATGPCSFHADIARNYSADWWDYDNRSTFGYANNEIASSLIINCPQLDNIDVDDYVKVWATVLGSYTYETTLGGSNTVPSFRIEKVDLIRKA